MLKFYLIYCLILATFVLPSPIFAAINEGHSVSAQISSQVEEKQTQIKSTPDPSPVLKTENSSFEAKGKITSVSGDNFDIEGITITKSPNHLVSISGNIEIGKNAEVKGVLENGLRYAIEIKVDGSATTAPSPTSKPTQSTSTPTTPQSEAKKAETPNPTVLFKKESGPSPAATQLPSTRANIIIGDQNIQLPKPTSTSLPLLTPETSSNFLIKPVLNFFGNLFKGWL